MIPSPAPYELGKVKQPTTALNVLGRVELATPDPARQLSFGTWVLELQTLWLEESDGQFSYATPRSPKPTVTDAGLRQCIVEDMERMLSLGRGMDPKFRREAATALGRDWDEFAERHGLKDEHVPDRHLPPD